MEIAVSVKDLYKTFNGGQDYVLDGMNLDIPRGRVTSIIGYSGTGKSVLLRHILGLLKPTSGTIDVLGVDLATMSDRALARFRCNFGVLFQYAALFDDETVFGNVCFPLLEHRRDLSRREVEEVAFQKLQLVELEEKHYDKLPAELSGGMKKRVGLARALALDPDILVYDEPTTGLDPIRADMVDKLILSTHNHRKGITSIVVTHDMSAAFRISDYVVMLDAGKVLFSGTAKDFLRADIPLVKSFLEKGLKHRLAEDGSEEK